MYFLQRFGLYRRYGGAKRDWWCVSRRHLDRVAQRRRSGLGRRDQRRFWRVFGWQRGLANFIIVFIIDFIINFIVYDFFWTNFSGSGWTHLRAPQLGRCEWRSEAELGGKRARFRHYSTHNGPHTWFAGDHTWEGGRRPNFTGPLFEFRLKVK